MKTALATLEDFSVLEKLTGPAAKASATTLHLMFTIKLNPFLFGYGVGTRANLLGYFIKFVYAFGIDNSEVKPPITYLTFGYDF